jgi:hypothetical protein
MRLIINQRRRSPKETGEDNQKGSGRLEGGEEDLDVEQQVVRNMHASFA